MTLPGKASKVRPHYIYYTEVTKNGQFVEARLSFNAAQYWSLAARRKGHDVTCRRMDTYTGRWDSFPIAGH